MTALLIGLLGGVLAGGLSLFAARADARRTLASSSLLGVAIGFLVELTRRPWWGVVFAGCATMVLAECVRGSMRRSRGPR